MHNKRSSRNIKCVSNLSFIYGSVRHFSQEKVVRLIADLEAYERFWYFFACLELGGVLSCC